MQARHSYKYKTLITVVTFDNLSTTENRNCDPKWMKTGHDQLTEVQDGKLRKRLNVKLHFFLTLLFFGHGEMSPTILRSLMGLVYQPEANE